MEHELFYAKAHGLSQDYIEALEIMHSYVKPGMHIGLENIQSLTEVMGNPQDAFEGIQIAGTNGKSSTSRFCAAILQGLGKKTGLYTSPELVEMRERAEVETKVSSYEDFGNAIKKAYQADLSVREQYPERWSSMFELITAAVFELFKEKKLDVSVLEVGLGGRWDATSIKKPEVACISGIGLDHTGILGDTLEEIAQEKAAIIKAGEKGVVFGTGTAVSPSVQNLLIDKAKAEKVPFYFVREKGSFVYGDDIRKDNTVSFEIVKKADGVSQELHLEVDGLFASYTVRKIAPRYQAQNLACAIAICEVYLASALDQAKLQEALENAPTPGRFQVLQKSPFQMIDACHNPQSVHNFLQSLEELFPDKQSRPELLLGILADKDSRGIIRQLCAEFPQVSVTQTSSYRSLSYEEIAKQVEDECNLTPTIYKDVAEALVGLKDKPFIACGSITLSGDVARLYHESLVQSQA
ncbi:MAG: Mur ligase family protein [Coriobacteriia bacterium]|nr:Mur ligase family protein [Coriobacteriia bacterium]